MPSLPAAIAPYMHPTLAPMHFARPAALPSSLNLRVRVASPGSVVLAPALPPAAALLPPSICVCVWPHQGLLSCPPSCRCPLQDDLVPPSDALPAGWGLHDAVTVEAT